VWTQSDACFISKMSAQEIIEISSEESDDGVQCKPQPLTDHERDRRMRAITWGLFSERTKQSILRLRLRTYVWSPGSPTAPHANATSEALSNLLPTPAQPASTQSKEVPPTRAAEPPQKEKPAPAQDAVPSQADVVPSTRAAEPQQKEKPAPAQDAAPSQADVVPSTRASEASQEEDSSLNSEPNTHTLQQRDRKYPPPSKADRRRASICRDRILRATGSDESDVSVESVLTRGSRHDWTRASSKTVKKRPQRTRKLVPERQRRDVLWVPPRHFQPARWPSSIVSLRDHFNPLDIAFEYETPFHDLCGCDSPCRHHSCANGMMDTFCAPNCCSFGGKCGNALKTLKCLRLVRRVGTPDLAVLATEVIEKGMVIGQYVGEIWAEDSDLDDASARDSELNGEVEPQMSKEYRYEVQRKAINHEARKVIIDAHRFGSITRFMNHSCDATARFHEVRNRSVHTVVVVASRMIYPNEEVTVHYGKELWFRCECGQKNCVDKPKAGTFIR
jgi:hypothetical protein